MLIDIDFPPGNLKREYSTKEGMLKGEVSFNRLVFERKSRQEFIRKQFEKLGVKKEHDNRGDEQPMFNLSMQDLENMLYKDLEKADEYNSDLKDLYIDSIMHPGKYGERAYSGFVFDKSLPVFEKRFKTHLNKDEILYKELEEVKRFLDQNVYYLTVDFEKEFLDIEVIERNLHVEEVQKYYQYLLDFKDKRQRQEQRESGHVSSPSTNMPKGEATSLVHRKYRLSDQRGTKTKAIKIFYALYQLRIFTRTDGTYPTITEFFEDWGEILGIDLKDYSAVMGQFKDQKDQTLVTVFEDMSKSIINYARRDDD